MSKNPCRCFYSYKDNTFFCNYQSFLIEIFERKLFFNYIYSVKENKFKIKNITMEEKYPYLGINQFEGKNYVVLFVEPDRGVILMNETDNDKLKFGTITDFDETQFEVLPQEQCVRLSN